MNIEVRLFIAQFVEIFAELLIMAIFIRVILSWFRPAYGPQGRFTVFISGITDPILIPIKKLMPRTGMLDLSPIIAFLLIELVRYFLLSII